MSYKIDERLLTMTPNTRVIVDVADEEGRFFIDTFQLKIQFISPFIDTAFKSV